MESLRYLQSLCASVSDVITAENCMFLLLPLLPPFTHLSISLAIHRFISLSPHLQASLSCSAHSSVALLPSESL